MFFENILLRLKMNLLEGQVHISHLYQTHNADTNGPQKQQINLLSKRVVLQPGDYCVILWCAFVVFADFFLKIMPKSIYKYLKIIALTISIYETKI